MVIKIDIFVTNNLAWLAARRLAKIAFSKSHMSIKISLFRSAVESVLLYGLETVPLTATRAARLNATHRQLLRFAIGVRYPDIISSTVLYDTTKVAPATITLDVRCSILFQRIRRQPDSPAATLLRHEPVEMLRRGGASRQTFRKLYLQ